MALAPGRHKVRQPRYRFAAAFCCFPFPGKKRGRQPGGSAERLPGICEAGRSRRCLSASDSSVPSPCSFHRRVNTEPSENQPNCCHALVWIRSEQEEQVKALLRTVALRARFCIPEVWEQRVSFGHHFSLDPNAPDIVVPIALVEDVLDWITLNGYKRDKVENGITQKDTASPTNP